MDVKDIIASLSTEEKLALVAKMMTDGTKKAPRVAKAALAVVLAPQATSVTSHVGDAEGMLAELTAIAKSGHRISYGQFSLAFHGRAFKPSDCAALGKELVTVCGAVTRTNGELATEAAVASAEALYGKALVKRA